MTFFANQSPLWVFVVIGAAGVLGAAVFYRRTSGSVSRRLRMFLAVLRAAALVLLALALVEPVVAITRTSSERPVVAVLLDGSSSMATPDGTGGVARGAEAYDLLNEVLLPRVARDAEVVAFGFSSELQELAVARSSIVGVPLFDGQATDLSGALSGVRRSLAGSNLGAVVLASDGAANRGGNPADAAAALGVPVFALGVGAVSPPPDVVVREVLTNRISYTEERLPIEVRLSGAGFGEDEIEVRLTDGDALIDSRRVRLPDTGEEETVTFSVVPQTEGVHRYSVSVPAVQGELTISNNTRVVATTTLKGRLRVLLAGGSPSWDFAFLRRGLEADANVELTAFAERGGAALPAGSPGPETRSDLLSYDLVVLVATDLGDPPVPGEWIADFVRDRGGGLLVLGVPERAGTIGGDDLASLLPIVGEGAVGVEAETRVALTGEGERAPSVRVAEGRRENAEIWESLPPVWTAASPWWAARPDAAALLVGQGAAPRGGSPIVVAAREGRGNVMLVAARGIWRWKMAGPEDPDVFDRFLAGASRWLTARGGLERVAATTDRDVYASGERVALSAQVFGDDLRPLAGAKVEAGVSTGIGSAPLRSAVLSVEGDRYTAVLEPLPSGTYVYEVRATRDDEQIGSASGEFAVEAFSLEDAEARRRPAILRAIAEATGGAYVAPETIDDLPPTVPLERRSRTLTYEFELWNSPWLLLSAVGLFALEWTLRRRRGLP